MGPTGNVSAMTATICPRIRSDPIHVESSLEHSLPD
jgi:hypothetical protein